MSQWYAALVSVVILGLLLWPMTWIGASPPTDSFPQSHYPMFSEARPKHEKPVYVVAVEPGGGARKVHGGFWTSGGFNQASKQLRAISQRGPKELGELCERIALRVGELDRGMHRDTTTIEIRLGYFDLETYFGARDPEPVRVKTLASCPIPGR